MKVTAVCVLLAFILEQVRVQSQGQACNFSAIPDSFTVREGDTIGTEVSPLPPNVELFRFEKPQPPPFLAISDGKLVFNDTLLLDQNDLCNVFNDQGLHWTLYFRCKGEPNPDTTQHIVTVELTDDYPLEFTHNFTVDVQEVLAIGADVVTITSDDVIDRDCAAIVQFGIDTVFHIEAGNINEAFVLANQRTGKIVVNRPLDYENGDTEFLLNISISDRRTPERKSYTTVRIVVENIDDNDPVFVHDSYILHVREEDQSTVGVWRSTVPPIAVTDPDQLVKDPLLISLHDPTDASILSVNSSSGEVTVKNVFDRETQPSVTVILKVQQSINSHRSSTTTLTLLIDDVNDNRPLFLPSIYDVTLAEHASPGTLVTLVSATDDDVGDNAKFSYVLDTMTDVFSVVGQQVGQELYGALVVRNSSLLDRETSSTVNVTISTHELSAIDGGNCTQGQGQGRCHATVRVTLVDINDHSPVFDQLRYTAYVNTSHSTGPIVTVKASDGDTGANAQLTYSLRNFAQSGCDYVTIDVNSGDVSLTGRIASSEKCVMMVTACDNPVDITQRRCAAVPLQIVTETSSVTLLVPVSPLLLSSDLPRLQSELTGILDTDVNITVTSDASPSRSLLILTPTNTTDQPTLSASQLQQLVDNKAQAISAIFNRYSSSSTSSPPTDKDDNEVKKEEKNEDFSPLVIALIVLIALLMMAVIVALVFVVKGRRRHKRQERLIEKISTQTSPIYNNANPVYDNINHDNAQSLASTASTADNDDNTTNNNTDTNTADTIINVHNITDATTTNNIHKHTDNNDDIPTITATTNLHNHTYANISSMQGNGGNTDEERGIGKADDTVQDTVPDSDSGVPSDPENAPSDLDPQSSQETSPIIARDDSSLLKEPVTNFNAVLGQLMKTKNHSSSNAVDLESILANEQNGEDPILRHNLVDNLMSGHNEEEGGEKITKENTEEDKHNNTNHSNYENVDVSTTNTRLPDSAEANTQNADDRPVHNDPKASASSPAFDQMFVRTFKPPMKPKTLGPKDDEFPEEPEPDYGKKVRFDVETENEEIKDGGDIDKGKKESEEEEDESLTIPGSTADNFINTADFHNVHDEITAL